MKIEISDNKKWQHSLTLKILLLAVFGVFLLIPLELIKSIIRERLKNSEDVKKDIAFKWSGQQTICGPILNVPVWIFPSVNGQEPYKIIYHIMPESLIITGDIHTEKRHRSIYQAVVYTSDLELSGEFVISDLKIPDRNKILWEESYVTLGISDNRGLKGDISFQIDSENPEAIPGPEDSDLFVSGITFRSKLSGQKKEIPFVSKFTLSGSESLLFSPVGKTTEIRLQSSWNAPGFSGNFLPSERSISESGFNAKWLITNLNRNFPQAWPGRSYSPSNDNFGVDFILPVDHYQKSLRSAKYGILFIALTFLALIFVELTIKENIHIFQYILVALGLVLFFSLLNAISEHTGFNMAYLISATSTILLISFFLFTLIKKYRPVLLIFGLLTVLYSFIFILLTLNEYAYLAGNIGLFVILGVTMALSAKLNLFNTKSSLE